MRRRLTDKLPHHHHHIPIPNGELKIWSGESRKSGQSANDSLV